MNCRYEITINGVRAELESILDLSKYYYINGGTLSTQRIFSSVQDVINTLNVIAGRTDDIKKDDKKTVITKFISEENKIFRKLGYNQDRLSPEYIEESRVLNSVLKNLPFKISQGVTSLQDLINKIEKNPEYKEIFENSLNDIKSIIESEELGKSFGVSLHKALALIIRGANLDDQVSKILKEHEDILDNKEA